MKMLLGEVRRIIADMLVLEYGPKGKIRKASGKPQYKIGKVEDENQELSLAQVDSQFPGASDAWAEVVPDMFPEHPFADDPQAILMKTLWFRIGPELRVAFEEMPQLEVASWDPDREDWFPIEGMNAVA